MDTEHRGRNAWVTLTRDLQRYTGVELTPWSWQWLKRLFHEAQGSPAILAIVVYRYGQWLHFQCHLPLVRQLLQANHLVLSTLARLLLQVELAVTADIGPGLKLLHVRGTFVPGRFVAGSDLTLGQGVLIGCDDEGQAPRVGDGVTLHPGCKLIGGIQLGHRCVVEAGAVVVHSFEDDDCVVGGVPARLLRERRRAPRRPAFITVSVEGLSA